MAESTLSVQYSDLTRDVGIFLGYGSDSDDWSENETAEVDRVVQEGYRQFLYPPAVEGIQPGYEWSFLKPVTTITTTEDDGDQDLPDDFGRLVQGFTFPAGTGYVPILADVGEGKIREQRQLWDQTGRPKIAGIRIKAGTGTTGQRKEVMWYPTPDDAYTLTYRYEAFVGKLTSENCYPLGGMKHSSLLTESCLAVAESRINDEQGVHTDLFMRLLASSIIRDKNEGPKFYGNVGSHGEYDRSQYVAGRSYTLEVSGYTIQ